jgi:hypothetical protein
MTSMSGTSDGADQQSIDDHRRGRLLSYTFAAAKPIATWPRLAIWLGDAGQKIHVQVIG